MKRITMEDKIEALEIEVAQLREQVAWLTGVVKGLDSRTQR